jgi:hypothetical protein
VDRSVNATGRKISSEPQPWASTLRESAPQRVTPTEFKEADE